MCKEMMKQRNNILKMFKDELENCLEKIEQNGGYYTPAVMVDLEKMFISNREYFENQGFFFESQNQIVNEQIKCYAWMQLGGDGELVNQYWKKIRDARKVFINNQRKKICNRLKETQGYSVFIDLNELSFENKMYFEECGYIFEHETRIEDGKIKYLVCMRKRH